MFEIPSADQLVKVLINFDQLSLLLHPSEPSVKFGALVCLWHAYGPVDGLHCIDFNEYGYVNVSHIRASHIFMLRQVFLQSAHLCQIIRHKQSKFLGRGLLLPSFTFSALLLMTEDLLISHSLDQLV